MSEPGARTEAGPAAEGTRVREREAKLLVPGDFRMPALEGLLPGVHAEAGAAHNLDTLYLDTGDLRLARWGATLRHRAGEGWTVKLPRPGGSRGVLEREEVVIAGDRGEPPAAAVGLVRALVRAAPLEPVLHLRARRHPVVLRDGAGRTLVEVVDDEVAVVEGDRVTRCFREVEVEQAGDDGDEALEAVVTALRRAGADASEAVPKHVRALGAPARRAPEPTVPELSRAPRPAEIVRAALARSVVRLIRHDAATRLDVGPEPLHRMLVATRRLRSDLRTFRPLLDQRWADDLHHEVGWLSDLLGEVRDPDVLGARLARSAGRLAPDLAADVDDLRAVLLREHDRARSALWEGLDSDRYLALLDRLVGAATDPRWRGEPGGDVDWLHRSATDGIASAAGWLAGLEAQDAVRHREDWVAAWKRVRKRRPGTW